VEPNVIGFWDPNRIEQIVENLISNAIKYAPGSPIHVTLKPNGEFATLEVQDLAKASPKSSKKKYLKDLNEFLQQKMLADSA